jgi:hypothetical protein
MANGQLSDVVHVLAQLSATRIRSCSASGMRISKIVTHDNPAWLDAAAMDGDCGRVEEAVASC